MDEPGTHYFSVKVRLRELRRLAPPGDALRASMPVWTPGSYLVREFARNVLEVAAFEATTRQPLAVRQETKSSWLITLQGADEISVEYSVYAFSYTTNASYLDTQHAVINGASAFLYFEGLQREQMVLTVRPYPSWGVVSTGLEPASDSGRKEYLAENYDVLVDSPIEIGNQHVYSFEVKRVKHEVSIFSPRPVAVEEETLVSDLRRIVEATLPIFGGEVPYRRYVFLVDFGESATGGLEHLNSTLCIRSYYTLEPPPEYRYQLSLFAHEFFHTWNVKRMRPAGLGPFDYSAETYTKLLWVAEGLTSYYEDVILRRAGIFSAAEFLDAYCENISLVRSLPASRWKSPEESSFNAWTNHYRPNENTPNVSPSYYSQGAALGGVLDLTIRRATAGARSLDDVMHKVYLDTYVRERRGYTDEDFEQACREASEGATAEIFRDHVHDRKPIDFQKSLGYAGLTLAPRGSQAGGALAAAPEGFLGIKTAVQDGRLTILSRLSGSPAELCDLSGADEIIAVDGLRTDGQRLPYSIASKPPGAEVRLLIAREGVISERKASLAAKPMFEYRIVKKESATSEERALFKGWALEDWDTPLQYLDFKRFPTRKRLLDYI